MSSGLVFLLMFVIGSLADCNYVCYKYNQVGYLWQACTGQGTLNYNVGDHTFRREICSDPGCKYSTDRYKGMFVDVPNSWCWIAAQDLSGGTPCAADDLPNRNTTEGSE